VLASQYPPVSSYGYATPSLPDIYSVTSYDTSTSALGLSIPPIDDALNSPPLLATTGTHTLSPLPSMSNLMPEVEPSSSSSAPPDPHLKEKRRRNNAASARFRMKKKEREQELEKTTALMMEKMDQLQQEVSKLEVENKWLRDLITTKANNEDGEEDDGDEADGED
jgi:basic region leucine zipper protein